MNLPTDYQEIFNKAYLGVCAQGELGANEHGECSYRIKKNSQILRCGVGHAMTGLIPENDGAWNYEGTVDTAVTIFPSLSAWKEEEMLKFLCSIQRAHDEAYVEDSSEESLEAFKDAMKDLATSYSLKVPVAK